MTDQPDVLEQLFALPAADVPPHSDREEIQAAAKILHTRDQWATGTLMWWLHDTAEIHNPDETGGRCERDGDTWPCLDIRSAQKVAETIHIIGTEPLGDLL